MNYKFKIGQEVIINYVRNPKPYKIAHLTKRDTDTDKDYYVLEDNGIFIGVYLESSLTLYERLITKGCVVVPNYGPTFELEVLFEYGTDFCVATETGLCVMKKEHYKVRP